MDDDWRGIDSEWLRRVMDRLERSLGASGHPPSGAWMPTPELDEAFGEFRRFREATSGRRQRPVVWIVEAFSSLHRHDDRLSTSASELGLDQGGVRRLDAAELMELFADNRATGFEVARRVIELGFCRRACPVLDVTDRFYCRAAEDRKELGRQLAAWLREP